MIREQSPVSQDEDEDDLYSYFNKSVSAVQAHADQFERVYARPALETSQEYFDERPISATFLLIFFVLSFVPVVSFIGFSLFAVASFIIIALSCAFLASVTVILTFLSVLVLTLLITLISSIFLTCFGLSIYAFTRLFYLTQEHGKAGVFLWINEMKNAISFSVQLQYHPYPLKFEDEVEFEHDINVFGEPGVEIKHQDNGDTAVTNSSTQEDSPSFENIKPES